MVKKIARIENDIRDTIRQVATEMRRGVDALPIFVLPLHLLQENTKVV